jgi:hypothetical protein
MSACRAFLTPTHFLGVSNMFPGRHLYFMKLKTRKNGENVIDCYKVAAGPQLFSGVGPVAIHKHD